MERPVVIVDTREIEPYSFDPARLTTVRRALPAGDYALGGFEQAVAVERKSLADFASTVIRARERFRRELNLLATYPSACVVIEGSMRDILLGRYPGHAHPHAIFGAMVSITVDYSVPVFCCSDRQVACRFVEEYLLRCHRKVSKKCTVRGKKSKGCRGG